MSNHRPRLCVYCGSSSGNDTIKAAASELGQAMVRQGFDLVYGGASIGIMGTVADGVLVAGGKAFGVMPASLADREIAHRGLTELRITQSMHERKTEMADLSDAFVALPGGLGTLEELFEIWTWAQLGFHQKPIGLYNLDGFFDPLLTFLDNATATGFIKSAHRDMLIVDAEPVALLQRLLSYQPATVDKLGA